MPLVLKNGQIIEVSADQFPPPTPIDPRLTAELEKGPFCIRLMELGVLPPAEAALAARGEWPATFAAYMASLAPADAARAEIEWATVSRVRYDHPMLKALALMNTGDDQVQATALLDAIFGIGV